MAKNISIYLKENQKSLAVFCKGDDCERKGDCLRYVGNKKVPRIPSQNCINLNFDLFLSKGNDDGTRIK